MDEKLQFPSGFLWGASTSSHQVEGHTSNDWNEWEKSTQRLEKLKKSGELNKHGLDNFISHKAANHYHLYKDDFALAKKLGHNATRLSIEWSRIEPREGEFDRGAIKKYGEMTQHLRTLGIEPFVTLWHWTLPKWLAAKGGWKNKSTIDHFVRYATTVTTAMSSDVTFWITLNEPEIYTANSYLSGIWPPEQKNPGAYLRVLHNLIRAHNQTYRIIKKQLPNSKIGIAKNNIYFEPHTRHIVNKAFKKIYDWGWNFYFLNSIKNFQDFIGLNYYFHNKIRWGKSANDNTKVSDLGWELYPEGIYHVLKDLRRYNKPLYVTENGLADATDKQRAWFIVEILRHVHRAIQEGADVKGYLHWSLIDNFEWDKGFYPRFGLIEVDYKTMQRYPRASAHLYADIAQSNSLTPEHIRKGHQNI